MMSLWHAVSRYYFSRIIARYFRFVMLHIAVMCHGISPRRRLGTPLMSRYRAGHAVCSRLYGVAYDYSRSRGVSIAVSNHDVVMG